MSSSGTGTSPTSGQYAGSTPTPFSTSESTKLDVDQLTSAMQYFGIVDYLIFFLMLLVCAVVGYYFGFIEKKQKKSNECDQSLKTAAQLKDAAEQEELDYLVGGRKMKVFPVSVSLVASYISGISLLGTSTEVYVYGTQYAFVLVTYALAGIISYFVFLPVFCNLKLTSTYEYFELRFNKSVRLLGSILFTIANLIWLPIVIYVPAIAFNQVTGINIHIITPIVCIICIFYTTVGGVKAVIWTDVIQTIVMVGAIIVVVIKGTIDQGGFAVVWQRNMESGRIEWPAMTFDPSERMSMFAFLVGNVIYFTQGFAGNQVIVQRYFSLPSMKEVKWAVVNFVAGTILLTALCLYNGLLLYAAYYDCDPLTTKLAKAKDQLVPLLVMRTVNMIPGMTGIFIAGVFSAALSSLSTGLNSLTAVFLEDYIKPLKKVPLTERQTALVMRLSTILIGVLSISLVFVVEAMGTHVMQLSMTLSSINIGPLFGMFLIGLLLPHINAKSTFTGCVGSFLIMAWICIKAQLAMNNGELVYEKKPTSIEGCTYPFDLPDITLANSTMLEPVEYTFVQQIYRMSFMFYCTVGALLTIVIACISSLFFGLNDISNFNVELLTPCIRRFFKTPSNEYSSVKTNVAQTIIMNLETSEQTKKSLNV